MNEKERLVWMTFFTHINEDCFTLEKKSALQLALSCKAIFHLACGYISRNITFRYEAKKERKR